VSFVGKVKRLFVCSSCQRPAGQWSGRCSACGEWGTVAQHPSGASPQSDGAAGRELRLATLAPDREERRISSGFAGLDRVLGGGLVPGSAILLAGAPGIGKSTLLLQLASSLSSAGHPCLIASGEEGRDQVASRAKRLGLNGEALGFVPGRDLVEVTDALRSQRPAVLVVDSVHTIRDPGSDALPGGPGQVRLCADALIGATKELGASLLLIGHVTKEGDLAGPRTLEHAVDVVLAFDGDSRSGLRLLTGGKNRFGVEGEVAWFQMGASGLRETEAGPRLGDRSSEPGCAVALPLAGRRSFAVEVQALSVPTQGHPRRHVSGLDPKRFHIVAAVTDQATRLGLSRADLYGSSAGGFRLDDPCADLAVAVALASATAGVPAPAGTAFVGEVSLAGSVRAADGLQQRLSAALAAGIETVVLPISTAPGRNADNGVRIVGVRHLAEALGWLGGASGTERPTSYAP
jgi:DNA repair protein RadA/Sms